MIWQGRDDREEVDGRKRERHMRTRLIRRKQVCDMENRAAIEPAMRDGSAESIEGEVLET